ncbi:TPA: hypothetical protein N0H29_006003 [Pseudomonas aeruginosa]|uniref:hypothetical protein n=1 Tax=Pseudomonas aeruginosa TaxID=287 RepID=UPI0010675259|nr:hypothetical protein [Pseudomonas aeruginosa]TED98660.1 hypothetical protein IPC1507_20000 [Pseudomonas aeruginosa]TEE10062.1 hypothetical protein IPC1506_20700 [Pseudomonas aeruginosa]TEE28533.1 hypothetical protein IPC1505_01590 [Pseudomonas aeruginosa]TEE37913.1 hypothetical protein IPC1502_21995 [Pseudomonas aeruginosa]TER86986.1 hypothetical protein IPC31_07480 [Pseudomonas aeruginosa]
MTMTKRVLLKGEFFAEWSGSLEEAAALAGVPVGDLAFHPDDVLAEVKELRRQAYRTESDPLRLEAEFDAIAAGTEPDLAAWVAAVQAIKARYPLPSE